MRTKLILELTKLEILRKLKFVRSALYVPGSNARALEKARTLDADMLIVDLEDAVPEAMKAEARAAAVAYVAAGPTARSSLSARMALIAYIMPMISQHCVALRLIWWCSPKSRM